jgi:hypothetical protein
MSTLLVEPLQGTPLTQDFEIKGNRLNLTAIRPRLYMHNDPTGTFTLNLKYSGNVIATADFTMAEIKAGASYNDNEYHHGFIKIDIGAVLNIGATYTLELTSSGYTFSEASYLGWIKEFENQTNSFSESVTTLDEYPFGYQLWGY